MRSLIEAANSGYVLMDGAMGTELLRRGLPIGACTASWNVDRPDEVTAVHRAYVESGAQCLCTNTFSANRSRLSEYGLEANLTELNRRGVELARAVAGQSMWVIGSVGPCSGFAGSTTTPESTRQSYSEQISLLASNGVDALLIETVTDTAELRAAIAAARSEAPTLPILASFCFQKVRGQPGYKLIRSNETLEDICALLPALGIHVAGANCGADVFIEDYVTLIAAMRARFEGPLLVRPNAGHAAACGEQVKCAEPPEVMAEGVWSLVRAGATMIGGCCGTTPEHVNLFRTELDKL
jgi:5-methyltetrahydrofolate--homocysteine methyltransferase